MEKIGKELIFISWINRDGSGTESVKNSEYLDEEPFDVRSLSMTHKTYIAHGFNSFVVRLKEEV